MKQTLKTKSRASRFDQEYPWFPRMRAEFRKTAEDVLNGRVQTQSVTQDRCVGVEIECSCIRESDGLPLDEKTRNKIVRTHQKNPKYQKELGSAQIEVMTLPIPLTACGGFTNLREAMRVETAVLDKALQEVGARAVRLGSDPNVFADERCRTTTEPRYHLVPGFHAKHRRIGMPSYFGANGGLVRCDNVASVGAMSSIQYNLDCLSVEDGIELLNRAFVTGPYAVALGANARFLDGMDTGYADVRGIVWELSHDIRMHAEVAQGLSGRMGLPTKYFRSLHEYFEDLHDQPSILDKPKKAFRTAAGLYWKDARLKFLRLKEKDPQLVLEFRPLSLQPNVFEDYAMIVFALGSLMSAQARMEKLLPLPLVHDNRWSAMMFGTRGSLWMMDPRGRPVLAPASRVLETQLKYAEDGMRVLGASEDEVRDVVELWNERLSDGCPSDIFFLYARDAWSKRHMGNKPIDRELLRECLLAKKDCL